MEKIILVDGNNLLFRSYYATAYNGNFMKNSKGFPTNALFGFANMMHKIIDEENPTYIMVAFDKGKTFRHDKYDFYKQGRIETPNELKLQFPKAKELLNAMGIKYYEIDNYEADDIIGTFAEYCNKDPNFIGTIISSDKDLLQLISNDIDIKLLKQKDYLRYNEDTFSKEYGIKPINIIDLKALMGDASDNIPGVKGIGEKTALKLLQEYKTLDGIYENIDKIKGKTKEKLEQDKDNAYMSYEIATIYKEVPIDINIDELKYLGSTEKLNNLYEELEFYSFLKKEKKKEEDINITIVDDVSKIKIDKECAIYLELDGTNYHNSNIIGIGIYNKDVAYYIKNITNLDFLNGVDIFTYDLKKLYVSLKYKNIKIPDIKNDLMIASSLLEYNTKDDIAYLANQFNYNIPFYENVLKQEDISKIVVSKAKFIYEIKDELLNKIKEENMQELYNEIEIPLTYVLGDMEYDGVVVDKDILDEMGNEIKIKLEILSKDIYNLAGTSFNISSPQQLGEVLFERLNLPHGKKGKTGYSTAVDVLNKLVNKHPIIEKILEYRMLNKLYTTYVEGLINTIKNGKIHTIYTQTLTRTGRLSSIEPNLQNIPIRTEYGRLIRKAFVPSENSVIVSGDYSQIELRILAHMANVPALIDAFNNDFDIHSKTASDIFKTDVVTKEMRRIAKAVNFGIIYGISSFGLSENLNISTKEAKQFIDEYLKTYPGIKEYMDNTIKNAYECGYAKTLFNRKRIIDELKNTNYMIRQSGERMALNTPIQGTSADIIKKAMVLIHQKLKENNLKSKLIIQVHDELVFDCLKEEQEQVIKIMKDVMENVIKLKVPLKIDIEYGNNWYEAK
ncbi:MAG TPA: DNA polymerase I [Candidatus Faecisoma merdavium]|nr:DNA polymerase I [Candidatus Faecisoma merdavium]